jgi:hypothetical protein
MLYQPASWHTSIGRCLPGSLALIEYCHRVGFGDAGCYNDRAVRGAAAPSLHREGRAVDITPGARNTGWMDALCDVLTQHYEALGVQQIIWNHRSWRCDRTGTKWKPYYGTDPHTSHSHIELNWWGANNVTVEHILATLHPVLQTPSTPQIPTTPRRRKMFQFGERTLDGNEMVWFYDGTRLIPLGGMGQTHAGLNSTGAAPYIGVLPAHECAHLKNVYGIA